MSELDQAIAKAYASQGRPEDVNQVYLLLLQSSLFLPVRKEPKPLTDTDEPFHPLFAVIEDNCFMLAFDTKARLTDWAKEEMPQIDTVEISGRDLISGIQEKVFLVLNPKTPGHKEFSPDEILHLKKIVSKIDRLKTG